MRSTSDWSRLVVSEMVMPCSAPVSLSRAVTLRMPLASMSAMTSTCGSPRGAGRMPVSWNRPSTRLSAARSRSPCSTTTSTAGWLSVAVEKVSLRRTGMVVFRSMIFVIRPPWVSTPSDNGVTSSSRTSETSPLSTPAWMPAPTATTSSGFTVMFGSLPPVSRFTSACTAGIRVEPPTRMTSSTSSAPTLASDIAWRTGPIVRSTRSAVSCSKVERISVVVRCFGPLASAVTKGRFTWVWVTELSSTFALLGGLGEPLQRLRVLPQVDAVLLLELLGQVVDDAPVEVVAAQVGVPGRGPHLHHAVPDVEDAHVERAAAEVEHQHRLVLPLVQPVGQRRGGRLVDDPKYLESGDPAGVPRSLPLRVVEVRRNGDDRLGDLLSQLAPGVVGELAEDERGDLLGGVQLAPHLDSRVPVLVGHDVVGDLLRLLLDLLVAAADEPLDRVDRPLGIEDRLPPGPQTHQPLPALGERHHGRGRPGALRIGDDGRLAAFPGGDDRVGRTQVDANRAGHVRSPFRSAGPRGRRGVVSGWWGRSLTSERPGRRNCRVPAGRPCAARAARCRRHGAAGSARGPPPPPPGATALSGGPPPPPRPGRPRAGHQLTGQPVEAPERVPERVEPHAAHRYLPPWVTGRPGVPCALARRPPGAPPRPAGRRRPERWPE